MDFEAASRLVTSPQATPQDLTDICNAFPELRASAAIHPHAHPELLNWLARLGDPAVNAALATRAARQQPAESGGAGWIWVLAIVAALVIGFLVWRAMTGDDGDDPGVAPTETTAEITEEPTDEPSDEPTTDEATTEPATDDATDPDALGTVAELFPDPEFAACVAEALAVGLTEPVTQDQLDSIGAQEAADLQAYYDEVGIDIALDGGSLSCIFGMTEDLSLDGVQNLRTLAALQLGFDDGLAELDTAPLADLDRFQALTITTNDLEIELDVTHIDRLEDLEAAGLVRVTQETFDALPELEKLRFLAITPADIADFGFLLDLPALERIQIGQDSGTLPGDIQAELESRGVTIVEGQ